jgi:hypothetical protein
MDQGYSVQQTTDGGYVLTGYTDSYGAGKSDVWLIKTNETGSEQWNKTYGGSQDDLGKCVLQTADGGYVILGETGSYGIGTPGYSNIWLFKTNKACVVPKTFGEFIYSNMVPKSRGFITNFTSISFILQKPSSSNYVKVQYSQDKSQWYNAKGIKDGWDILANGSNNFDLTGLQWNGTKFYYRMTFKCYGPISPILSKVTLECNQYSDSGYYIPRPCDSGTADKRWLTLSWTADIPYDTELKFQIRSAPTGGDLSVKDFVGPDGSTSTYYSVSGTNIPSIHDPDRYMQVIANFSTSNNSKTPTLEDITITYNIKPSAPSFIPISGWYNISTPNFQWNFNDVDGTQSAFQLRIDDDSGFNSINYDSGIQTSTNSYWQFPSGTGYINVPDGIWYCQVRTKDNDGDWSPYSSSMELKIDATKPTDFTPSADPSDWTSNNKPLISFTTNDNTSGIDHYEILIDNVLSSTNAVSPYELPELSDGSHKITVRAYDKANNYKDGNVDVYIDTEKPVDFTPSADPSTWTNNRQPVISFSAADNTSGIDHYELLIDNVLSSANAISPFELPELSDGLHKITVRGYDKANNYKDGNVNVYIDTEDPADFLPTADPSTWTSNRQPIISFSTTESLRITNR